jgi:hypothetical protein
MGTHGVGSIDYVGAVDRRLLGDQAYVDPAMGILERLVTLTENSANYQALEMRHRGSLASNLYDSLSYTWAHSIDDGSLDSAMPLIHPGYSLSEARGSSNLDVRHSFTGALSYRIPAAASSLHLFSWLGGWTVNGILRRAADFPSTYERTNNRSSKDLRTWAGPTRSRVSPLGLPIQRSPEGGG